MNFTKRKTGILAEGGASVSFVNRSPFFSFPPTPRSISHSDADIVRSGPVGLSKANETLLWGKKKDAQELLDCGFVK